MTRAQFIASLKKGLRGLPGNVADGIAADYESFFDEGSRAGRTEADLVTALGDPARLAAELRLAVVGSQWQTNRSPRSVLRAVLAAFALIVMDALLLLPLGISLVICAAALVVVAVAFLYGLYLVGLAPFSIGENALELILMGIGFIAGAIAGAAVLLLGAGPIVKLLSRYSRLHSRLLLLPPNVRSSSRDVTS